MTREEQIRLLANIRYDELTTKDVLTRIVSALPVSDPAPVGEECDGWHGDNSSASFSGESEYATCNICKRPVKWLRRALKDEPEPKCGRRIAVYPPPAPTELDAAVGELIRLVEDDEYKSDIVAAIARVRAALRNVAGQKGA